MASKLQNLSSKTRNKIYALKITGILLVIAETFDLGISTTSFFIIYSALTDTNIELINNMLKIFGTGYGPAMVVIGYILFALFSLYLIKISFISNNFKIAGILGITTATLRITQILMVIVDPKLVRTEIMLGSVTSIIYIVFVITLLLALMELSNQINSSTPFLIGLLTIIFIIMKLPLALLLTTHFSILNNASLQLLEDTHFLILWFEIGYLLNSLSAIALILLGAYFVDLAEKTNRTINNALANKELIDKLKDLNTDINQAKLDTLSRQLNLNKLELGLIREALRTSGSLKL